MVPVRSALGPEVSQPEVPAVLPIRLLPWEVTTPRTSGIPPPVFPATIVLVSVAVPPLLNRPPPPRLVLVVLPLTVQLVSVAVPPRLNRPPPPSKLAVLPLT